MFSVRLAQRALRQPAINPCVRAASSSSHKALRHGLQQPAVIADTQNIHSDHLSQLLSAVGANRPIDAFRIVGRMKDANVKPNIIVYNQLLEISAQNQLWFVSWAILDDMLSVGIEPSALTFAYLIAAQRKCASQNIRAAWKKMEELGIEPSAAVYGATIDYWVNHGKLEMALRYFLDMKAKNLVPDVQVAQRLVVAAATSGYSSLAIDMANYYESISPRKMLDRVWLACLDSSAKNLHLQNTLTCWNQVVHNGSLLPGEATCMAVLNTAVRSGNPDLATEVLHILSQIGVEWEEHHFSALIEALCNNGKLKEAFITLQIMRTNDIVPSSGTLTSIATYISSDVEKLDGAWTTIDEIHQSESIVGLDALKIIIQASVELGDLQRAIGVYKSLGDYNLTPDATLFNMLLEGCTIARHRPLGDLLLQEMKAAGVKADADTYTKAIQLCLTQDVYEDTFFYLEEMKAAGFVAPESLYQQIFDKCSISGDSRSAMVLQEMEECGYKQSATSSSRGTRPTSRGARK